MASIVKEVANNSALRDIKTDLTVLKDDATATLKDAALLAQSLKNQGGNIARDGVSQLKAVGQDEFQRVEERIRSKPGQSVALAFCAGLVFSYLLGSRR